MIGQDKTRGFLTKLVIYQKAKQFSSSRKGQITRKVCATTAVFLFGAVVDVTVLEPASRAWNDFLVWKGVRTYEKSANELSAEMESQTAVIEDKLEGITKKMMNLAQNDADVFSHFKGDFEAIIAELNDIKPQVAKLDDIQTNIKVLAYQQKKTELDQQGFSKVSDLTLKQMSGATVCEKSVSLIWTSTDSTSRNSLGWDTFRLSHRGATKVGTAFLKPAVTLRTDKNIVTVNWVGQSEDNREAHFSVSCEPIEKPVETKVSQQS